MNRNFSVLLACLSLLLIGSPALAQETTPEKTEPEIAGEQGDANQPVVPDITESRSGQTIELSVMLDELARQDVIFLGEQHDNQSGHDFQLQVIQGLVDRGLQVVISTEQFERDVQGAVNDYLTDRISEAEFLKHSRPWRNYQPHYKPIIEFARSNSLPVLAANTPGFLSAKTSKGETSQLAEQVFLPRATLAPEDEYWQNFVNSMKGHVGADGVEKLKTFYAAQCLKDDSMAESITDYLAHNRHQPKVVVHLCGHFHSDYGLGTVARVLQRSPLLRTCVVTMQSIPKKGERDIEAASRRAHFVFWTVADQKAAETKGD